MSKARMDALSLLREVFPKPGFEKSIENLRYFQGALDVLSTAKMISDRTFRRYNKRLEDLEARGKIKRRRK